jgi:hypothetical protein
MINNKYIFEVSVKDADGNFHLFSTVGENVAEVHYNFNDKVYNGQPIEIVEVKRIEKIVEGYTSNLELNPDYKPLKG